MDNKISQFIFNKVGIPNTKKYLDLSSFKHKLTSGNIANVSTPGYKAENINFDSEYKKLTAKGSQLSGTMTHTNHIPTGNHAARGPKINAERVKDNEMNSVDIDKEMSELAQNELRFTIGATLLQRKFEGLRKVITSK